jgi:hypothetical protein
LRYKVEEKLRLGVSEKERVNAAYLSCLAIFTIVLNKYGRSQGEVEGVSHPFPRV